MNRFFTIRFILIVSFIIMGVPGFAQCSNSGSGLSATTSISNINCTNNDGSITVNAINGFRNTGAANGTGYLYAITAGPITRPSQTGNVFAALPTGTYTLTVTDCNSTTITLNNQVVGGTLPAAIVYIPVIYLSICANNNAIKLNPSGGRAPYTITVITSPSGSSPSISGDTIRGLAAGSLTTKITDACGNSIQPVTTITANPAVPASNTIHVFMFFNQCAASGGPSFNYATDLRTNGFNANSSQFPTGDSFYTELYYNGVLKQTIVPPLSTGSTSSAYYGGTGMNFTGYGFGAYTLKSYYKCSNSGSYILFKTDSVQLGNKPSSPTGTNSQLAGGNQSQNLTCTTFDELFFTSSNGFFVNNAITTPGQFYNFMNKGLTATILSGPSNVGSVYTSTTNNVVATALPFGGPYVAEVKDDCGSTDTVNFTVNSPFSKLPTSTLNCGGAANGSSIVGTIVSFVGSGRQNIPNVPPNKFTILSGTDIPWMTGTDYPITVVDTLGIYNFMLTGMPPSYTYTVAFENACGQKDTTVYTASCTPITPGVVSSSVTPLCGNKGNLTLINNSSVTSSRLYVSLVSGPSGNTISGNSLDKSAASATYINQPTGTYVFRGNIRNYTTVTPTYAQNQGNEGFVGASQTSLPAFPMFNGVSKISYSIPGTIDSSKLRIYDTTFTVIIPATSLFSSILDNYYCKSTGSGSTILSHTAGTVPPFSFSYSTAASTGPFTNNSPATDSFIFVAGLIPNTPLWIKTTDACGTTAIVNTTVASLASSVTYNCSAGIATITPNPYSAEFQYDLVRLYTGAVTSFTYPVKPTINLNGFSDTGKYALRYRLISGSNISCVIDSDFITAFSPCALSLVPLPIHLLQFTGSNTGCSNSLYWQTSDEKTTSYFSVEKSLDGITYSELTRVNAGNSSSGREYHYSDPEANYSLAYYRLKIVDNSGASNNSPVVSLLSNCGLSEKITVQPNPATDLVHISGITENVQIHLLNAVGQQVLSMVSTGSECNLDIHSIPKGSYFLKIRSDNGMMKNTLLIKK